jgi:hypothetical protein
VAACLVAAVLALTLARTNPWRFEYLMYIPVAGAALLAGALVERALRGARGMRLGGRIGTALLLLLVLAPWAYLARWSPLFFHYGEGEAATAASHAFFVQARALIEQAPDGSRVAFRPATRCARSGPPCCSITPCKPGPI